MLGIVLASKCTQSCSCYLRNSNIDLFTGLPQNLIVLATISFLMSTGKTLTAQARLTLHFVKKAYTLFSLTAI